MKVIQPLKLDIDFYDVVVRRERAAWGPYFKAWGSLLVSGTVEEEEG